MSNIKQQLVLGLITTKQNNLRFFLKNGYARMSFNDRENHESAPNDVTVGNML